MGTAARRHERFMNKAVSSSRSFRIRSVIGWSIGGDDNDAWRQKSANALEDWRGCRGAFLEETDFSGGKGRSLYRSRVEGMKALKPAVSDGFGQHRTYI